MIAHNLLRLQEAIGCAALRAGRRPEEITLVGVSKTQPAEAVVEAVRAGVRHVGENRVQEAAAKLPLVRRLLQGGEPPVFHMVGHLQTNKAAAAISLFDRIDAIDSVRTASALARRLAEGQIVRALIEVYVGDDPSRPGVRPEELVDVTAGILELRAIRIEGFMTVAPLGAEPRPVFARVRALRDSVARAFPAVHFGVLSMGMSADYAEAVEEGSTEVRIGAALFGPRQARP